MRSSTFASLILIGSWLGAVPGSSQQTAPFHPILELEKPVYLLGESIRFWIGVHAEYVPEALRESGVLHWVNPDGSQMDEHVGWPADGNPARGWKGGWGFEKRSPSPGRYVVSFEFAGQKTADQQFEIVPNSILGSIDARWSFEPARVNYSGAVLLHVENNSGRVLRFAKPGLMGSEVSLHVRTLQTLYSEDTFVPQSAILQPDEIPSISFDRIDWETQSKWPMITLPAGGSGERKLALRSIYPFRDGQEYEMTISTVLTVFVGERDDSDAQLFPLRIPVSATARFH
jgi:hypothetical protein